MESSNKASIRFADFFMCWCALCGLVNAAIGSASFGSDMIHLALNGEPVNTWKQRLTYIGIELAWSGIGFCYMLWREQWRCKLSTIFQIVTLWCTILGAAMLLQTHEILGNIGLALVVAFVFWYTINWSSECKPQSSR
jgi:uncharacterized membrane protein YfcA